MTKAKTMFIKKSKIFMPCTWIKLREALLSPLKTWDELALLLARDFSLIAAEILGKAPTTWGAKRVTAAMRRKKFCNDNALLVLRGFR